MADDANSPLRIASLSRTATEQPVDPPVRNLRDRDDRPAAPEADRKAQGTRLMLARQKHFKTASMAARALGIAGPTYLAHENGTRQIRDDIAVFYAEQFNVSPNWLLFNKGSGPEPNPADVSALASPSAPAPASPSSAAERSQAPWENGGLNVLLQELKACRGPNSAFVPRYPRANEPGRLPPASHTDGWIAELASPARANGYSSECPVAVSDGITLVLRDVLLIPALAVERSRLFAVRLQAGVDLFGGQHVFVDPDDTHVEDENMFLVTRLPGSLMPACLMRCARTGQVQIGRSRARPPMDFSEANVQIVGRIVMQLKPLADAEVHEIAESMLGSARAIPGKLAVGQ